MKKTAKGSVQMDIINGAIAMVRINEMCLWVPKKNSVAYQRVKEAMENKQQRIRTGYTRGTGRWSQAVDVTDDVCRLLDLCDIAYYKCNDAPRGGVNGNYVKLITKIK